MKLQLEIKQGQTQLTKTFHLSKVDRLKLNDSTTLGAIADYLLNEDVQEVMKRIYKFALSKEIEIKLSSEGQKIFSSSSLDSYFKGCIKIGSKEEGREKFASALRLALQFVNITPVLVSIEEVSKRTKKELLEKREFLHSFN